MITILYFKFKNKGNKIKKLRLDYCRSRHRKHPDLGNKNVIMKVNDKNNDGSFKNKVIDVDKEVKGWGYRHQQCLILFFCLTIAYSMRACMGVALVAMEDKQHFSITNSTYDNKTLDFLNKTETAFANSGVLHSLLLVPPYPSFKWNKKIQDSILSSFFLGYMLLQIPAGQLAHYFGARYLLTGALFINCVMSFCLPWAAYYGGWILTSFCRMVQGLSQACVIPGMHTMFGKWTTLEERGRLAGLAYGGQALGTVLGLPITGFIASSPLGWPGIFRFYGLLCGMFAVVIWTLGADSPAQHPKISAAERYYIENSIGNAGHELKKKLKVPWGAILKSPGMYAIIAAHIGNGWGQLTLYTEVPAFMDKVMGVNIKANGLLTALPFLVMWFTNFFFTWFTDMLINKKILSVRHTRKLANSLGSIPASIGLIGLAFAPKNIYIVETILVLICGFKVSSFVGFHVNHIDISSNFSGTMMSISNFACNCVGSLAPLVAGFILTDVTDENLWRKVFYVSAGFYFMTNLIYVIFGTAEKAEWDNPPEEDTNTDIEKTKDYVNEIEPMLTEQEKVTENGENDSSKKFLN